MLGPDGGGKSTLARLAAENYARRHPATLTRWVTGTPTERVVPFGAFGHLIDIADVGKPARKSAAGLPMSAISIRWPKAPNGTTRSVGVPVTQRVSVPGCRRP